MCGVDVTIWYFRCCWKSFTCIHHEGMPLQVIGISISLKHTHSSLPRHTHTDDLVPTYTYLSFENLILMGLCLFDNVGVSFCHVNGLDMCKFVFLHIAVKVIAHVCVRGWMSVSSIFFTHCATLTALRPQILYVCPEDNLLFRGFFFVVYGVVMEFSDIYLR